MSQIERGGPGGTRFIRQIEQARPLSSPEELRSPGLAVPAPLAPVSPLLITAEALGVVADASMRLAGTVDRQRAEAALRQEQERATTRGLGVRAIREAAPSILDRIQAGEELPGDRDTDTWFNDLVAEATDGLDPAAVEAARESFRPDFERVVVSTRRRRVDATRTEVQGAILDGASAITDTQEVAQTAARLRQIDPELSERAAETLVIERALSGAAAREDLDTFDRLAESATSMDPLAIRRMRRDVENTQRARQDRQESELQESLLNFYAGLETGGYSPEAIRRVARDDPRVSERLRLQVYERQDARLRAQTAEAQSLSLNALQRDVFLGRIDPEEAFKEAARRMDLSPEDPDFISARAGEAFAVRVEKATEENARVVRQRANFQAIDRGEEVDVATSDDDRGILSELDNRGLIRGNAEAPSGLNRPLIAAGYLAELSRVPQDIQQVVGAGINSANAAQVSASLVDYIAIRQASPSLAASMEMSPLAKIRARFVESRIDQARLEFASEAEIEQFVSRLEPEIARLNPRVADIDADAVAGVVYFKNSNERDVIGPVTFERTVRGKLKDDLSAAFRSDASKAIFGIRSGLFVRDTDGIDNPPDYVIDTYRELLVDEFRIQRSFIPDDNKAAARAKDVAIARTFDRHRPIAWGNRLSFGAANEPWINAATLKQDVAQAVGGDVSDRLWRRFTPVYRTDLSEKPGWVFYESTDPASIFRRPDGKILIVDGQPDQESVWEKIQRNRQSRKDQPEQQPINFGMMGGMN